MGNTRQPLSNVWLQASQQSWSTCTHSPRSPSQSGPPGGCIQVPHLRGTPGCHVLTYGYRPPSPAGHLYPWPQATQLTWTTQLIWTTCGNKAPWHTPLHGNHQDTIVSHTTQLIVLTTTDHLVNRVHQWKGGTLFSPIKGEHQAVIDTLVPFY